MIINLIFACLVIAYLVLGSFLPCEQALRLGIRYSDINRAYRASILSPTRAVQSPCGDCELGVGLGRMGGSLSNRFVLIIKHLMTAQGN